MPVNIYTNVYSNTLKIFMPTSFNKYIDHDNQNINPVIPNIKIVRYASFKNIAPYKITNILEKKINVLKYNACFCFSKVKQRFDNGAEIYTKNIHRDKT